MHPNPCVVTRAGGACGFTNPNPDKAAFRAPQRVRIKARSAGNGSPLVKERNAESGPLWGPLRGNRWVAIRGVAPAHHRVGYRSADAPSGLTAQQSLREALPGFGLAT